MPAQFYGDTFLLFLLGQNIISILGLCCFHILNFFILEVESSKDVNHSTLFLKDFASVEKGDFEIKPYVHTLQFYVLS